MSDQRDPVMKLLSSLETPEPPASLRSSALSRAAQAWAQPANPDRWRQIWESRPLRLAWATVVVALVAAHFTLPSRPGHHLTPAPLPEAAASVALDQELQEVVRLPRLRETYVAMEATKSVAAPSRADSTALDKEKTT